MPLGENCLELFYNKKMFENEKVNPPETWDELRIVAKNYPIMILKALE